MPTQFKVTVNTAGSYDYSTWASAITALACSLTGGAVYTCNYDNQQGDLIADGQTVNWDGGSSTGTLYHMSTAAKSGADAFLLLVTAGSLADDDTIVSDADASDTFDVNGTPDSAYLYIELNDIQDTTPVDIDGYDTDADNYIKCIGDRTTQTTYSASHYRLEDDYATMIQVDEDYVYILNVQIHYDHSAGSSARYVIDITSNSNGHVYIGYCIIKGTGPFAADNYDTAIHPTATGIVTIYNTIVYNWTSSGTKPRAIVSDAGTINCYNCTVYNVSGIGLYDSGGTFTVKNCAVGQTNDDFNGCDTIDYCASDDATGTNAQTLDSTNNYANEWTDAPNGDFRIVGAGSVMDEAGTNNPEGGTLYDDDFIEETRS